MSTWVLRADGALYVSDSFRQSMRTIAALVIPDEDVRERARRMDRHPELAEIGAAGTFYQWVRHLGRERFQGEFCLEEHRTGGRPGEVTLGASIDMLCGLDPSFEVQVALWQLADDVDVQKMVEIARVLEYRLRTISDTRDAALSSLDKVLSMRAFEERFGGIRVLSGFGRPDDILSSIPADGLTVFHRASADILSTKT